MAELQERSEELARTEVLDTGKPIWEARFDILGCADTIEYYGGLAPSVVGTSLFLYFFNIYFFLFTSLRAHDQVADR